MPAADALQEALDHPCPLTPAHIAAFDETGFIKLPSVLPPSLLDHFRQAISAKVHQLNTQHLPMDQRSTYDKAFLQIMNLWTHGEELRRFVFGKRLARIAAELMGCSGVRVYHDQALYKEPGGGITPWHADQYYWPVSSHRIVTAWIPLQDTPLEMGPLAFSIGSHHLDYGRDLEISDESEARLQQALAAYPVDEGPFLLGDVSFHSGWTFHRAGPNITNRPREVMTTIYMDEEMRLIEPRNKNHILDTARWCPGIRPGERIASPLNPVLYSRT